MTKSKILILIAALAISPAAVAQQPTGNLVGGYDYSNARQHPLNVDATGRLNVIGTAAGGSVFGPDATGTAPTQAPVYNAGLDTANHVRPLAVDTSGNQFTVGNVAGGATDSGNPVKIGGVFNTTAPTYLTSQRTELQADSRGNINVDICGTGGIFCLAVSSPSIDGTGSGSLANYSIASRTFPYNYNGTTWDRNYSAVAAASGLGLGIPASGPMGIFNTTNPTLTNGMFSPIQMDSRGNTNVDICAVSTNCAGIGTLSDGAAIGGSIYLNVKAGTLLYDGSNVDRTRSIQGSDQTGIGITATSNAPNSNVNAGIVPVVSSALEASHVLKASAGNLYRMRVTTTGAGYLLLYNAIAAPANGAVTPQSCTVIGGAGTLEIDHAEIPDRFSTGIAAVFSTTGCFTQTTSATAMFEGSVE